MSKFLVVEDGANQLLCFVCLGCRAVHSVPVRPDHQHASGCWGWNGDVQHPTLTPSVLVRTNDPDRPAVCHFFVRAGQVQFLGDCQHALAGQTIDMPTWSDAYW